MIRKADLLNDVREQRSIPTSEFEFRSKGNTLHFHGHASTFDQGYEVNGGPNSAAGWMEFVSRSAFKKTLSDSPHVHLYENHGGMPLASTKSGTLNLSTDSRGLVAESHLDLRDPQVQSLAIKMERGDVDEMSFAFRVLKQTWSNDETERSLDEVSLHKGDVSIVNFGANPHTSATLRNAVRMLASGEITEEQFAELRAMGEQVDRAMAVLRADKPYGDVAYADPKDGKYPIDTKEHVKAAWSYINMPKNQKGYTPGELAAIKGKIRAAAKKFGIEIGDEQNSAAFPGASNIVVGGGNPGHDEGEPDYGPKARPSGPVAGNIKTDGESAFVQQVHDLARNAGANCDPTDADGQGNMTPMRSLKKRALSPYNEDYGDDHEYDQPGGDVFDQGEPRDSSLAQAIHDMCVDGGADCGDETELPDMDTPMYESSPETNSDGRLTIVEAQRATVSPGNLKISEVMRLLRPEDAPEPLSIADALRLAAS